MIFEWACSGGQTIRAGGIELECRAWGPDPAAAPTFVLLHEGLGSVGLWRDFPQVLVDRFGFGVFAYSRGGYGRSTNTGLPKSTDYHFQEALDVLPAVLDETGVKRSILFGHSDGGTIAALYGCKHSDDPRLAGLVVIAPHFFAESIAMAGIRKAVLAYQSGQLRDRLARHHDHPDTAFYGWADTWLNPAMADWDIRGQLAGLRCPVLAIQGAQDEYGTPEQIHEIARCSNAPVTELLIPSCGHAPHVEAREVVLDAMDVFLDELSLEVL